MRDRASEDEALHGDEDAARKEPVGVRRCTEPDETRALAAAAAARLRPGDLVFLRGDLGAGKTVFAQGLAAGLGAGGDPVHSPTYTLVHLHPGPVPFAHADLYRLGEPDELEALGLVELLEDHVICVEWPERADGLLGAPRLDVDLVDAGPDARDVTLRWHEDGAEP